MSVAKIQLGMADAAYPEGMWVYVASTDAEAIGLTGLEPGALVRSRQSGKEWCTDGSGAPVEIGAGGGGKVFSFFQS